MKIACILGQGFEDSEFSIPYERLRAAGHDVFIVGEQRGQELVGEKRRERTTADLSIDDVSVDQFDALLIPGGYSPDKLRADGRFVELVRDFDRAGKPILAVCHGPQLLLTAGLVGGRTLTAWKTVQGDLRYAKANVVDREVVVDGNWVTSRQPGDLDAFVRESLRLLGEQPAANP